MGDPPTPGPRGQTRRASTSSPDARAVERDLLRLEGRMRLASLTPRLLVALADRLPLLQDVANRRHLGADTRRPSPEAAPPGGPRAVPERRYHRLANDQDHREGRPSRVRRRQEDERQEAAFTRGHRGSRAQRR